MILKLFNPKFIMKIIILLLIDNYKLNFLVLKNVLIK